MESLNNFQPTSKIQLRQFCITFCEGDVKRAAEMYDYYAAGINLPDTEPVKPWAMQAVKENAVDIFGFLRDNQTDIINAIVFIKSIFSRGGGAAIAQAAEAIPKIN